MQEAEALSKMVAPGQRRPGVWREGILQIMVTRACDQACFGCTQLSNLGGRPVVMSPQDFETAVRSLEGYFGVVGVFGGNPCVSPYFEEYCRILREHVPFEQRGLWSNHPRGKGALCRETFNPAVSNINVHLSEEAYQEFVRDWPESIPFLNGLQQDSRHGSPWVSLSEVYASGTQRPYTDEEKWALIADCDINQLWSALIGVVPGKGLRAFFCEIAYAMCVLHATDPDWPDVGLEVTPGWWRKPMEEFTAQVRQCCFQCGVPLRREGQWAIGGQYEEVSPIHAPYYQPKVPGRPVRVVSGADPVGRVPRATEYLPGLGPERWDKVLS